MTEGSPIYAILVTIADEKEFEYKHEGVQVILDEFQDVFSNDLTNQLPPMCNVQHAINLVPGATLPNLPHYHLNLTEHVELR